jgi:CO dehydrogenase/acetyl-CoA synthase epsilon subunit
MEHIQVQNDLFVLNGIVYFQINRKLMILKNISNQALAMLLQKNT